MRVVYDGSFEGFLSLVYDVYYKKLSPTQILKEMPQTLLLEDVYEVAFDELNAMKVFSSLQERFLPQNLQTIQNIFLCEAIAFEMDLLAFIVLGFKSQKELQNINNPALFRLRSYEKQLFHNYHKMSGFLRFVELSDGSLYAKLESRFNLAFLLGRHFKKRLNNQEFYIHDVKRTLVFVHTKEYVGIRRVAAFELPEHSEDEAKFQRLWKEFFKSVTIESRKNERLQKQTVPLLYRTYMSEFEES
jgi:probable DNA metabolism protein